MSPAYKQIPTAPAIKGLNCSADVYTQPKGSFPRLTNFLLNKRGALDVCDGSALVHAYAGAVQSGRGKVLADLLFSPTGVPNYYLALIQALDLPLGNPRNLTATDGGAGGTFPAGTYYFKVTAIDGAGGETTASNEASVTIALNHQITLTWNVVPNAQSYNIYRGTASGAESLLSGTGLPVPQPASGSLTATFTDTGAAISGATVAILTIFKGSTGVSPIQVVLASPGYAGLTPFQTITIVGVSPSSFNGNVIVETVASPTNFIFYNPAVAPGSVGSGGSVVIPNNIAPPTTDTTQQLALFKMPLIVGSPANLPVSYSDLNIVALFPAGVGVGSPGSGGGGGSGGSGGTGATGNLGTSTPSGGIQRNTSLLPQFVQFTNRAVIALGNGFPPQIFSDPTTPTNPATVAPISAISVDAFGVVTVTTSVPHGLTAAQVGGNVSIAGVGVGAYTYSGPTIAIVSTTQYKVRNIAAIGSVGSSGGTSTTTAVPITSTFVPGFPTWSATTAYNTNNVTTPDTPNGHYYIAKQGGVTGATQPTFPTATGAQVSDGSIIWQEAGPTNTAAPPPPGCGHVCVYAGALLMFNTSPTNTSTGIDGPCSLRQSDINNPNSWNPVNQAFLDKDDGTEGMGLATFTITAQGIPPEGSLVAYKNYSSYQVVGVFGSPALTIQRVKSDMGCLAPRTLQFVPGFGIARFSHLGFAIFDGVDDRVVSEEIRPYLFATNDFAESDIVVLDANWQSVMWGAQTSNPPMWCIAMPVGTSNGQLTQIACFDLVLKAWAIVALPFPISTMSQFRTVSANPVTILGGFSDGCLSRWQAGDQTWDVGATGARTPSQVNWSLKLPETASQSADTKLNCRRVAIRGINTSSTSPVTVVPYVNGVAKHTKKPYTLPTSGDFEIFASFMHDGLRFSAIISGSGQLEMDRFIFHVTSKEVGAVALIS